MTVYRLPPQEDADAVIGLAAAGPGDPSRWLTGLCATYERWPQAGYEIRLPLTGLPLYHAHQDQVVTSSGMARADIGAARRFAAIPDLGIVCLIELTSPSALFSVRQGTMCGLSGCFHFMDDTDPVQVMMLSEVSLTDRPSDPRCRVISHGRGALHDWEILTGEVI